MKFEILKVLEDFELLVVLRRSLWEPGEALQWFGPFHRREGKFNKVNALLASPEAL